MQQSSPQPVEKNMLKREPEKKSPSPPVEIPPDPLEDASNNGNKIELKAEKPVALEKEVIDVFNK